MGISGIPVIPMIITRLLQGTLCDTGIPRTFYGGKICSVHSFFSMKLHNPPYPQSHIIQTKCDK